ncbi:MAG: hypothetical protein AABZ55_11155 [Bdellovibrionota bacterium]
MRIFGYIKPNRTIVLSTLLLSILETQSGILSFAADAQVSSPQMEMPSDKERNFYEVLDDLMGDFEYDLKNGNVVGLRDLSIRNIALSENIPQSFKAHLELLLTEKILKNSKTKMIQCLPRKSRKTILNGDQVVVTSPDTNPVELSRIAKQSGIMSFMDAAFTYEPSGMVLSMHISDPESGSILWSRSYNSETSRTSAHRRGVDFSQVDEARAQTEYTPTIQYRAVIYYLNEPNVSERTGCLGFGFRMMERYDNRKKEVGFEMNYLMKASSIVGGAPAAVTADLFSGINITLLFVHTWNLIGSEENFNHMRGGIVTAIGGTYASGFLGALARGGYEWRLGKHSAVTGLLGYRPSGTKFLAQAAAGTVSGLEFGVGISYLF